MADDTTLVRTSSRTTPASEASAPALADRDLWIRATSGELHRLLDASHVIGEPMHFGETTLIPLLSMGFGFGAGGGGGQSSKGDRGQGGGGGGGGGIKPVAFVVVNGDGVRLEPIPSAPGAMDKLGTAIAEAVEALAKRKDDGEDEDD